MMKKISKYFLLIISIFFIFSTDANAITFGKKTSGTTRLYVNDNLEFKTSKSGGYNKATLIKLYKYDGSSDWKYAYCADRSKNYYSYSSYKEDKNYREKAKCKYKIKKDGKWVTQSGGDCSKIVGYIIKKAYSKAGGSFPNNYGYAQTAIWVYLGLFTEGNSAYLKTNNINVKNAYNNNSTILSILHNAWTSYYNEVKLVGKEDTESVVEDPNLYSVTPISGLHFSFVPNSIGGTNDSCGPQNGHYETQEITIKNNQNKSLKFKINTNNADVKIKYGEDEYTEWTPSIPKNGQITFTLKIPGNKFLGSNISDVLTIYAELETKTTTSTSSTTYDSRRWSRTADKNNSYSQGLIVLVTSTDKDESTNTTKKYKEVSLNATQDEMTFLVPDNPPNKTENTGECANNGGSVSDFTQTRCMTIPFNDGTGAFVRIILTEAVEFQYGYLFSTKSINDGSPSGKVYAGGSFELNTNRHLPEGAVEPKYATTYYKAAVKWTYADLKNGQPYYYKGSSTTELSEGDLASKVFSSEQLKSNGTIELPIYSKDSNNYKDSDVKNVHILQINPVSDGYERDDSSGRIIYTAQFKDTIVKSLPYEIEVDGEVSYKVDEHDESIDVPRGYFIPMHYKESTFPYNIGENKNVILNILETSNAEQEFEYSATCNVEVVNAFDGAEDSDGNKYGGLRYRPIDVKNPFPKNNIPGNWSDGSGGYLHAGRISDTFDKQTTYEIDMDNSTLNNIKGAFGKYFEWSNMNESGISTIIRGYGTNNNKSYCKIGEFIETGPDSCDK